MIIVAAAAPTATRTSTSRSLPPATTAAKARPTTRPFGLRLGLIDFESSASKLGSVQGRNSLLGFAGVGHLDKGESARPSGFAVGDHADAFHGSVRLEQ